MKTRCWILLFGAILAVLVILSAVLLTAGSGGTTAQIYQDGVLIRSIDLSLVTEPETFTITDENGHENVIEVEQGRIRVRSANCPDGVCVDTGWISDGVKPIVCLPAKLVIQIEKEEAAEETEVVIDAVSG